MILKRYPTPAVVLEGNKWRLLEQMWSKLLDVSDGLDFEEAAKLRDEIRMLESLDDRG